MKIFGVGLSRTGGHSLSEALSILGYKTIHYPRVISYPLLRKLTIDFNKIDAYDALTDTTITRVYKELDRHYPDSKFIFMVRDMDSWLTSCERHFKRSFIRDLVRALKMPNKYRLRYDLYGTIGFNEKNFKEAYKKHTEDVMDYFKDRKKDLLVIDICSGEGWEKLCPFLNKSIPDDPATFPRIQARRSL